MKKAIVIGIVAGVVIVGGGATYLFTKKDETTVSSATETHAGFEHDANGNHLNHTEEDMVEALDTAPTRAQVALHATATDCWTIIDNSVYNLTSFIGSHEGGDNILSACGVDATNYFNGQNAGQEGDKKDHTGSNEALEHLESLKLGDLAE